MQRYVLKGPVQLHGPNIHGIMSVLELSPTKAGSGWFWRTQDGALIPITPELMRVGNHCVQLEVRYEDESGLFGDRVLTLNEFEHIGALRAAGLEGVIVEVGSTHGETWPPYFGGAWRLWEEVKKVMAQDGELEPWRPGKNAEHSTHNNMRRVRYERRPLQDHLTLSVHINYEDLGGGGDTVFYPQCVPTPTFEDIMAARTLGWPKHRWWLSKAAPVLNPFMFLATGRRWVHHKHVLWPQEHNSQDVIERTARHRMQDMLGVYAFAAPMGHHLTGYLYNYCGGHAYDIPIAQEMYRNRNVVALQQPHAA